MPLRLAAPVYKTFKIVVDPETGEEGEFTVTIRQATRAQTEQRAEIFAETTRVWNDENFGQIELKSHWTVAELEREEVRLTMCECDILDEDGNALFRSRQDKKGRPYLAMSKAEFDRAWGMLPDEVARAIHEKVLEVNPQWRLDLGE